MFDADKERNNYSRAMEIEEWFKNESAAKCYSAREVTYDTDVSAFGYITRDGIPSVIMKDSTQRAIRELWHYNESLFEAIYSFVQDKKKEQSK